MRDGVVGSSRNSISGTISIIATKKRGTPRNASSRTAGHRPSVQHGISWIKCTIPNTRLRHARLTNILGRRHEGGYEWDTCHTYLRRCEICAGHVSYIHQAMTDMCRTRVVHTSGDDRYVQNTCHTYIRRWQICAERVSYIHQVMTDMCRTRVIHTSGDERYVQNISRKTWRKGIT
jgi:hypothetical protein